MIGDRHKSKCTFIRWMEATCDGVHDLRNLKHPRVPSNIDKRFNRRWNRRMLKEGVIH